jgi:hypothetical protein
MEEEKVDGGTVEVWRCVTGVGFDGSEERVAALDGVIAALPW